jgi:hypothetical protein
LKVAPLALRRPDVLAREPQHLANTLVLQSVVSLTTSPSPAGTLLIPLQVTLVLPIVEALAMTRTTAANTVADAIVTKGTDLETLTAMQALVAMIATAVVVMIDVVAAVVEAATMIAAKTVAEIAVDTMLLLVEMNLASPTAAVVEITALVRIVTPDDLAGLCPQG